MIVTFSGRVHRYSISPGNTFKLDYRSVAKGYLLQTFVSNLKTVTHEGIHYLKGYTVKRYIIVVRIAHSASSTAPTIGYISGISRQLFRLKESIHCIKSFLGMFHAEPLSRWYIMTTVCGLIPGGWGEHFRNFWVGMCSWDPGALNLYQS